MASAGGGLLLQSAATEDGMSELSWLSWLGGEPEFEELPEFEPESMEFESELFELELLDAELEWPDEPELPADCPVVPELLEQAAAPTINPPKAMTTPIL
jgi:hypothetical protein